MKYEKRINIGRSWGVGAASVIAHGKNDKMLLRGVSFPFSGLSFTTRIITSWSRTFRFPSVILF